MQAFLASDVLYQARTAPLIKHALDDAEIGGQKIATSRFLPGIEWLSEQTIAAQLDQQLTGGSGGKTGEPAPGLHGTGHRVGQRRRHDAAARRAQPHPGERGHRVRRALHQPGRERRVRRQGQRSTSRAATSRSRPRARSTPSRKGQTAEASLPLGTKPPTGSAVTVKVTVAKVPGEQKTDNNTAEYDVLFTDGLISAPRLVSFAP